jgi:hypothetical protein
MKKYRLKKEAVPFFNKKYATAIYDFDIWEKQGVDIVALEEIEDTYVTYGHQSLSHKLENTSTLSGWDKNGSRFHFTLNFPSTKIMEHDKFSNGKIVRKLMDEIQAKMNSYFVEFNNDCA